MVEVLPPGITLWEANPKQALFIQCEADEVFFGGSRGGGKMVVGKGVTTPTGIVEHSRLKVGDTICDAFGGVQKVVGRKKWKNWPIWKVTFHDGTHVLTSPEHEWTGWWARYPTGEGMYHGRENEVTLETQQIKGILDRSGKWGNTFMIPLPEPVEGHVKQHFMEDLYVLGAMLGDGHMAFNEKKRSYKIHLTSHVDDHEIADRINQTATIPLKPHQKTNRPETIDWYASARSNIRYEMENMGMIGRRSHEKDFPESLLYAPLKDRWALMQGLMDTDGTISPNRAAYFTTTSQKLADKVTDLARSLGCLVTRGETDAHMDYRSGRRKLHRAYKLRIKSANPEKLFHLTRKRDMAAGIRYQSLSKKIVSIEDTGQHKTGVCIQVSHPSGLYVTDDGTVTHNSNAILADFYHHEQRYGGSAKGILFRRTFPEFQHMREMADAMFADIAKWDAENNRYVWSSGAWLRFAYLEHDRHVSNYHGQQYTWQGWDELTEWASAKYFLYLRGSLRSTDPNVRLRVVATGNPGRQGHGWVKQRFVDPAPDGGRLIYDADLQLTRMFIPSFVWDNPQIFENQPRYIQNLRAMSHDSQLVKAMLFGDWDVFVGQAFPEWNPERHTISLADAGIKPEWQRFCSVDFATTKPYAILYFAIDPDTGRIYCYNEDYGCQPGMYDVGTGEDAYTVAKRAYTWSNAYGGGVTQAFFDRAMKANQGAGASVADLFVKAGWTLLEANKDRIEGRRAVHRLLQTNLRDGYPMLQFTDNCSHTIRTLPTLVNNTRIAGKEEDVDDQSEDHLYDALRYFAISHHMMPGAPRFHVASTHRPDALGDWNPMADFYSGNGTYGRLDA